MGYITDGMTEAIRIIVTMDREFLVTVLVSIKVAFASTFLATLVGVPFAVLIAEKKFPGRSVIITVLHTLMSLPTVVVGLMVYSLLSFRGPLGGMELLFTQSAMVIGQFILAFPIIAGLAFTSVMSLDPRVKATALSLGADSSQGFRMFLREARFGIMAAVIAGFGRVFAEVGVSMMLGGNIRGYTRNITTAIALETSKGEFALGIALGLVLLTVALVMNILFGFFRRRAR